MRVFFATDIHGSEVCWRKFLNAGKFHKADVLIMGGDMTGKAMVPIVGQRRGWELELQGQRHVLTTEDEVRAMEKRISDRGYYPVRLTRDEVDAWAADPTLVDTRFKAEMLGIVERWMALGRRAPRGHRASAASCRRPTTTSSRSTRSSTRAELVELGEANTIALDGFTLVSTGWANPTPWNTFRELPEPELRERIDGLVAEVPDPHRAIFNFHAPPYGSNLDNAPKLDADMNYVSGGQALVPVGSQAVRECDPRVRPAAVAARPHPRGQGRGQARIRPWRSTPAARTRTASSRRPSSTSMRRRATVKRYLLING